MDVLLLDTDWYSCNKGHVGLKDKQANVVDTGAYIGRVGISYRKL